MKERQKWVDHKFNLGIDPAWAQNVKCRLKDTSIRIMHHCKELNNEQLSFRLNDAWSIKEHIGHLIDLEQLFLFRLKQFSDFPEELVAADMTNTKTHAADHNNKNLDVLITAFNTERCHFIKQYGQLDNKALNHPSMHPRIKEFMRPVDLLFFVAEHDNHHITSITDIIQSF